MDLEIIIDLSIGFPINNIISLYPLTGKWISKKYFTYRSVQIFKIMFPRFLSTRIWSAAQDHTVLLLLLNVVGVFISMWQRWSDGNVLYHSCTSFEGASRGGPALKYLYMIHRGGQATGDEINTFGFGIVWFHPTQWMIYIPFRTKSFLE